MCQGSYLSAFLIKKNKRNTMDFFFGKQWMFWLQVKTEETDLSFTATANRLSWV